MALQLMCIAAVVGIACYMVTGTVPRLVMITFAVCALIVIF